jgi:hypothetical protein
MEGLLMGDHADIDHTGLTGVGSGVLNKFDGTAAPTVNDDTGDGYTEGSMWVDVTNDRAYICLDDSSGAAVWREIGASLGIQTYTPTWTAASVNPALGNGTITGHYQKIADKLYWLNISLLMGSTTTYGTGRWIFSLPFTAKTTSPSHQVIAAQFNDSGTAAFTGSARVAAGATVTDVVVSADATGTFQVASAVPFTWANTDRLIITGVVATD